MQISHLSSNRREQNSALIPDYDPNRKLTQDMNFGHSKIIRHFGPENIQIWNQKDTNFGKPKIIHHFGSENPQNPTQIDTNFEKMHSLTPAKMPTKQGKYLFFQNFVLFAPLFKCTH